MKSIPILMYHNIDDAPPNVGGRGFYVSPQNFARQMRLLSYMGIRGLSMRDAMPYLRGEKSGKVAVITLDDGYRDNVEHALPVLNALHFSATCYLVSQCMGKYNTWDAARDPNHKPIMDWSWAAEWLAAGMEIGAHSSTHPRLTTCSDAELDSEIIGCKHDIEDKLRIAVEQFSYPYGDWDERVASVVTKAGFQAATTTRAARAKVGDNLFALPRLNIKGSRGWRRIVGSCFY